MANRGAAFSLPHRDSLENVERAFKPGFQAGHVGVRADVFILRCAARRMPTHLDAWCHGRRKFSTGEKW
jgi:hypothetical protein